MLDIPLGIGDLSLPAPTVFQELFMQATALSRPHADARAWPSRTWQRALDAATALRLAWRDRARLDREQRERALMAELDPRTLRDIGAPDWLEAEAHALREACNAEREQLRVGGATIDTRYW
jgi:hypothetical protein